MPPAGRSSSSLRHAGQMRPLWPALEGWRFRISTAPVTPPGPASARAGGAEGSSPTARAQSEIGVPSARGFSDGAPHAVLPP